MPQITVDTGMNTKPVLQGVKQMQSAIRSVNSIIGKIGKSLDASVVGYANAMSNNAKATRNLNDSIHVIEGTIANLQLQMNELANTKIDTKEYADLKKQIEGAEKELQKLVEAQKRLKDLGRDSVQTKEYTAIVKEAENAKKEVEQLQAAYDKIDTRSSLARGSAKSIKKRLEEEKKNYAEYGKQANIAARKAQKAGIDTDIGQQYTAEKNRLLAMREESGRKIGSYSKSLSQAESDAKKYEQVLDDIGNKLDGAEKKYNGLISKQKELEQTGGATKMTEAMRTSQYEIKRATDKVKELEAEKKKLEDSGKATINGQETEEYKNATAQLEQAKHDLQQTQNAVAERTAPLHEKEWAEMATASHAVAEGLARVQNAANTAGYAIQHPLEAIDRLIPMAVSGLATLARKVLDVAASFGKWAINTIVSGVRRLASAALNVAVSLARMAGSAVVSFLRRLANGAKNAALWLARVAATPIKAGLKKVGSLAASAGKAILGIGKSARRSNNGLGQAVKMLIRYGFGVRSVFILVRRLRSALVTAFQNMAKAVPEVNVAISKMAASLGMLKNSMATAFQPILTAIAPLISQLMDMLSAAMTKVGMFFATLTGQDYVYTATKAQYDYAKSLDKTKKSAKEAENQLASFDKLDILKANKDNGSDTDTNAADAGGFTKTPVLDSIKNFANQLKDLFKNGEFAQLGRELAEKINGFFDKIDWEGLATKVGNALNSILQFYNGLMEGIKWDKIGEGLGTFVSGLINTIDPEELGRAFSQKINAIFGILSGFVSRMESEWENLGKFLAKAVGSGLLNIKWKLIGETVGNGITGIARTIKEFAINFPWEELGERIANGANDLFSNISWKDIADALNTSFCGILRGLRRFIRLFDWTYHGTALANGVRKFIKELPIEELGGVLTGMIKGVIDFILPTLEDKETWKTAGEKLATGLNTLFGDTEMWDGIGETFNSLALGILEFANGALDAFNPTDAANAIKTALGQIKWGPIASELWANFKLAISKAGNFVDALLNEQIDPEKAGASGEYLAKVTAFNQQSLGTKLGIRISEALNDAINNYIPWSDIGVTFNDLLNTGLDFANNFVKNFDTDGFLNGITSAMEEIEWDKVLEKILELMINAVGKVGDLTQKLIYRLFGFDDEETTKLISENMERTLEAAMPGSVTPEVKAKMRGYADESADTLADEFIQRMSSGEIVDKDPLLPWFRDADAKASQEALVSKMQEVYQYAADNNIGGEQLSESLFIGFIQSVTDNTTGHVKDEYKSLIENMFGSVDAINNGSLTMEQFFAGLNSGIDDFSGETKKQFLSAIDGMLTEVEESPEGFDEHSPSKRAHRSGEYYMQGLQDGIEDNAETTTQSMTTAMNGVLGVVETKIGEMVNTATTGAQNMTQPLVDDWSNAAREVGTSTDTMSSDVSTEMGGITSETLANSTEQREQLYTAWDLISSYVSASVQGMRSSVSTQMNGMSSDVRGVMGALSQIDWWSVGDNIVAGIQEGVKDNWKWLTNTVKTLANNLFIAAKNTLGIHSPSALFRDGVGLMIGYGIAEGLEDSQPEIMSTVANTALAMEEKMAGESLQIGVDTTDAFDGFGDKIVDGFETLISRLQAIADSVTFRTPAVAAGTVLPYNVAAQATSAPDGLTDALVASNDDLASVVIQATNNAAMAIVNAIQRQGGNTGVNDLTTQTSKIIDEINRRARMQGASPIIV